MKFTFRPKLTRTTIIGGLMAGIFFLVGFLASSQIPRLKKWILVEIEQISREHSPVRILPGSIQVNLLPLGATLTDVRILPKDDIKDVLERAEIKHLSISLSAWRLMQGRLRVTEIEIEGARVNARIPKQKPSSKPPLEGIFDFLGDTPVDRIAIRNGAGTIALEEPKLNLEITELEVSLEKRRGRAFALQLANASIQAIEEGSRNSTRLEVEALIGAARDRLYVSDANVRRGESFVNVSGEFQGDVESLNFATMDVRLKSELQLDSLGTWVTKTFAKQLTDFPRLKGRGWLESSLKRERNVAPIIDFKLRTEALSINQFEPDRVNLVGKFENDVATFSEMELENSAGSAKVENAVVRQVGENQFDFNGKVHVPQIQLHELLKSLGIPEVPVFAQLSGELPCRGSTHPEFTLDCQGRARGENLLVRAGMDSKGMIVALREFDAVGELHVDSKKVTYSTELAMPKSKGRSRGDIDYETGFEITYEADKLDFSDVASLADLKIEGAARVKGSTRGTSYQGTVALDLDVTDGWLEDFWLGNPKGHVSYENGMLVFKDIQGHYSVSRYTCEMKIDLLDHEIEMQARAPFFDARDLTKVFSRKFRMPVQVTGTGQASIRAQGPLDIARMSYELKSSLFRGSIAGEAFDQAHFDVRSRGGEVIAERVQLNKGSAQISLTGQGHPNGEVETQIHGRNLKIEDTAFIANSGLTVSGLVDFDMNLNGPILAPDTDLHGRLTKTSIGEQGMPDSNFRMKFSKNYIEGAGDFLGDVVKADFRFPLDPSASFVLKLDTNNWNFAPVFAAVAGPGASRKDFEGRLTTSIDLRADQGGFWNSNGKVRVDKFSLSRGSLALSAKEPLSLSMKNGFVQVQKFELSGENTFFRMNENPSPASKVDLQVNGKMDMSLLSLLTPFFEDLRGVLSIAFNLRAGPSLNEERPAGIDLLGSAYVEKGYLKFFEFPHPIEDIQIDLLFNQKKILFNTVRAELGGGRFSGTGGMELKGYKNFPVSLTGNFDKVTLEVPEKVRTTGSGNLSFTGNWFPFLLKIDYEIRDGLMTKDLGGSVADNDGIRRDYFLPELLLQENFSPILLDLDVRFAKGIVVKNEMVDGKVTGQLNIKGNPAKPSVLGSVSAEKDSKVNFRDTVFDVSSAVITFNDPNDINPKLYLTARSRVQEYDVTLLVQGTGSKPDFALTSVPPLPERDIVSLLALGATDAQLSSSIRSEEQTSATGQLITSGVMKKNPISDAIRNSFGVDVQFSPGFDDTNSSAVQKIIVSRQFSQKLDVTASRSFGKTAETEAKARYRLNDRLSLVGTYLGRDLTEVVADTTQVEKNPNRFGIDVEYKFEFK